MAISNFVISIIVTVLGDNMDDYIQENEKKSIFYFSKRQTWKGAIAFFGVIYTLLTAKSHNLYYRTFHKNTFLARVTNFVYLPLTSKLEIVCVAIVTDTLLINVPPLGDITGDSTFANSSSPPPPPPPHPANANIIVSITVKNHSLLISSFGCYLKYPFSIFDKYMHYH